MKTVGVSQKVWIPAVAQVIAGIVFLALGLDVEGKTAIGAGVGTFMVGYGAKPAPVENKPPRA
jgi:hypothetical protein